MLAIHVSPANRQFITSINDSVINYTLLGKGMNRAISLEYDDRQDLRASIIYY
jgi:hypothetical protein